MDSKSSISHRKWHVISSIQFEHDIALSKEPSGRICKQHSSCSVPYENRVVCLKFHDLFLESIECFPTFTVERRHVHTKYAHKTICLVLNSTGLALRCPRHTLCNRCRCQ